MFVKGMCSSSSSVLIFTTWFKPSFTQSKAAALAGKIEREARKIERRARKRGWYHAHTTAPTRDLQGKC